MEIDKILDENLTKRLNKIENKKQLTKIGMIGNLNNRIKGWDIALKALKLLKKNNIDFEFHVLGDGNTEIWLNIAKKYGIENRVFFMVYYQEEIRFLIG